MCGVLGTVNLAFGTAELDLIAHRGPDGQGLTQHDVGAHQVRLGHRRLAIVDLSPNGAQPMATADGHHVLTFNGEIYNHRELRGLVQGVAWRGHSDTESLAEALASRGTAVLGRLNGIFAFAWLDIGRRCLYLVRDPFGVKPLYYARSGEGFCFSSELKPLLKILPASLDTHHLATLLKLRYSPSPDTLLLGVHRLRPGHVLEVRLDGPVPELREFPYIGARVAAGPAPSLEEATRRYGELMERAVERQLMSDVEIGILLSGGVDSAVVAALARQQSGHRMKAFTVGFNGAESADADEISEARHTAEVLGLEHHAIRIGFDDFLGSVQECMRIVEEPLATTSIVPMRQLASLAANHVKVVLSGQGADEPLGGYGRYQLEIVGRYVPRTLARAGRALAGAFGVRNETLRRGLDALSQPDDLGRFCAAYAVFSDAEIERLTGLESTDAGERLRYFYDLLDASALPTGAERMMALDLRLGLADDLLLYTDKITMNSSLECRVPILDRELISYIESLPYNYRVTYGSTKIVHKRYAAQLLPPAVVGRPKKGFLSPTRAWFRDTARLRSVLLDKSSRFASVFDLSEVDRTLTQHARGYNRERHIFLLLCLYFWLAEFT